MSGIMTCSNNHPMRIIAHKRNLYVMKCNGMGCGTETGLLDDHIYFTHPRATKAIGDTVTIPTYDELLTPSEPEPEQPKTPKPSVSMGTIKLYDCKGCHAPIDQAQAMNTYDLVGRALCKTCLGAELSA